MPSAQTAATDAPPSVAEPSAAEEQPRGQWTMSSRETRFDKFSSAICYDIRCTYARNRDFSIVGSSTNYCSTEDEFVARAIEQLGEDETRVIDGILPLPMSKSAYEDITRRYQVPDLLFKILLTGLATVTRGYQGDFEYCIFQQNATGVSSVSMIIVNNVSTRATFALVFGTRQEEANAIIDLLPGSPLKHWSRLPLIAMETTADDFSSQIKMRHNDVWKVSHSLQMDYSAIEKAGIDVKSLDLIGAARSLSSIFVELAYYSQARQTSQSLLGDIEKMLPLTSSGSKGPKDLPTPDPSMIQIQLLRSWYDGIQARSTNLTRRAEALLQTVYSLTAQRDSAINLAIAEKSTEVAQESMKIAIISREDNSAMKEIAIAAAKDSATMRVIAAVTLFFLPPTFVVTFFSTSFLDFKPTRPEDHVSHWIWLYFVLSVTTIVLVMGYWKWKTNHALTKLTSQKGD